MVICACDDRKNTIVCAYFAGYFLRGIGPDAWRWMSASGIGLAIAASRLGSAISTFLLPVVVAQFGVRTALGACVATLAFGCLACLFWAPETRGLRLDSPHQT